MSNNKKIKSETCFHPRNKFLTFNEDLHKYYIKGKACEYSVTKFITKFVGKFDPQKKAKEIQELKNQGIIRSNSIYYYMNEKETQKYWQKRTREGTKIHHLIENYLKYKKLFTNKTHILYKDFEKFLNYYDMLKRDGWKHFVPELKIYCDDPFIGGMIDLLVYRKNGEDYEYMLIDWKRSRNPNFVDYKNKLDFLNDGKIKSPLFGKRYSTHLKNSLQINIYLYIMEKYYSREFFLFQPNQKKKLFNVYFCDHYQDYYAKECLDLQKEVIQMFKMVKGGIV